MSNYDKAFETKKLIATLHYMGVSVTNKNVITFINVFIKNKFELPLDLNKQLLVICKLRKLAKSRKPAHVGNTSQKEIDGVAVQDFINQNRIIREVQERFIFQIFVVFHYYRI